ncbi:4-hydroxy-2-oxoheptanedioate aldolase [Actinocorallia herbida]|uniref:4-hydroxy-2-oxoheptanedioate aldolase n=1 Tax=Actinocorallia herbida TaxID=58109 RepID=A0A3N1CWK5_9ACTN|nr:aldolase/citrate lyase family protein [Actinocorallia herbida]ROO85656.1 4-hydroxy-2-oxoheptanedioate aldolase [Actinocorallia herbida]
MSKNRARSTFDAVTAEGRRPVGGFVMSSDPNTTLIYGAAGCDFVVIDREHGIIDLASLIGHLRSAEAGGIVPIVRVLENNPALIQQALDSGAQGVLVPKVGTADQARRAVAASRYQAGGRGMCPVVAGTGFSGEDWATFSKETNDNVILMPLIETWQGVENIAEIAAVEGVDHIFFGLADLSQDLGIDMLADADRLIEIWRHVASVAHAAGVRIGAPLGYGFDPEADFGTLDADLSSLRTATARSLAAFRDAEAPLPR